MFRVAETIPVTPGRVHAVLPEVDSRRALAVRPDPERRRPGDHGQRQAAAVAPRPARDVRHPRRRAAGREPARPVVPVPVAGRRRRSSAPAPRPRRSWSTWSSTRWRSTRPATTRARSPSQPSVTLPAGWKFGTALQVASQSGNTTRFKPVTLQQSGRFAADRRRAFQPRGSGSGRQGAGAPQHGRRWRRRREAHRQAARRRARGGAADQQAVRRAPLRALRLPADAVRPHRAFRSGASPVQRRSPAGEFLHRRHHAHAWRPA